MKFNKTDLQGVQIIEPEIKSDSRGNFSRIFCRNEMNDQHIPFQIVQVNRSFTVKKSTIRGMHFQSEPKAEDKIVICVKGRIYDVALDLRSDSRTFGKYFAEELSEENKKMLYIPKGFAHGFQTLTKNCELFYLMSEFYSPEHVHGVRWNDQRFRIPWPLKHPLLSEKDKNWPLYTL